MTLVPGGYPWGDDPWPPLATYNAARVVARAHLSGFSLGSPAAPPGLYADTQDWLAARRFLGALLGAAATLCAGAAVAAGDAATDYQAVRRRARYIAAFLGLPLATLRGLPAETRAECLRDEFAPADRVRLGGDGMVFRGVDDLRLPGWTPHLAPPARSSAATPPACWSSCSPRRSSGSRPWWRGACGGCG